MDDDSMQPKPGYKHRDYYEVLDIAQNAAENEIRRAYKLKALQYHPDKNHGNLEEAEMRFKEVLNAYTVLNDPKEREWYDGHKDSILKGNDGTGESCAPDEINLWSFMSSKCFTGFDDDEEGFFAVYEKMFQTVFEEEGYGVWGKTKPPTFGRSDSDYVEVTRKFYMFWDSFGTKRSFAWKDQYRASDGPNRYARRAIERENNKERETARRTFNKLLQEVVGFVKRKDPRVQAELERAAEEEARNEEEKRQRELERHARRKKKEQEWWEEAARQEEAEREAGGEEMDSADVLELLHAQAEMLQGAGGRGKKKGKKGGRGGPAYVDPEAVLGTPTDSTASPGCKLGPNPFEDDEESAATEDNPQSNRPSIYRCNLCKKTFSNQKMYDEHMGSNKHKTKVRQMAPKLPKDYICGVTPVADFLLDGRQKQEEVEVHASDSSSGDSSDSSDSSGSSSSSDSDSDDSSVEDLTCDLCVKAFVSVEQRDAHMSSAKHKNKVKQDGKRKAAEAAKMRQQETGLDAKDSSDSTLSGSGIDSDDEVVAKAAPKKGGGKAFGGGGMFASLKKRR